MTTKIRNSHRTTLHSARCSALCLSMLLGMALFLAGCRHVPVYHEPQGYSSSYDRAVQAADPLGEDFPVIKFPTRKAKRISE